ncbi:cobaltochelatase subunit CobN [Telmatospirillum sp. J64-1]|uniref:cobaltochelatase subunit CobN n=1 Tax=Telmatospirillum sp. J64-1 TaxID=2502183 RepID=UPI00115CB795|nr:cobaltochelatase subunit CobN [Telmatospirillum sp. J64-1]
MHLLAAQPGIIADGSEAIDLGQSPGDVVVLSAADTELACLAQAKAKVPGFTLRLANLMRLSHHMSVDLYVDQVVSRARLVVVRLLGGRAYWPYGVERIRAACRRQGIPVAFLPGDDSPDADLTGESTLPPANGERLWRYLVQGGPVNAENFLRHCASLIGLEQDWTEPLPLPAAGLYPPGADLDSMRQSWAEGAPVAAIVFYRALVQSGNLAAVDALIAACRAQGLNPLPLYVASLKDPVSAGTVEAVLAEAPPDVILNATGFAVAAPGKAAETPFADADCPVLQVVFSGGSEAAWREGNHGLAPRDIAMNVALPEVDGRILSRAVSFKGSAVRDAETELDVVSYVPVPDRMDFVAELAARWARLRRKPAEERRIAVILANYPNRDGRLGNGVGLDTPAGTATVLSALEGAGYWLGESYPRDGAALIADLLGGATNDLIRRAGREVRETLSLPDYLAFFHSLPEAVREAVTQRWGAPETDPHFRPGELHCGDFVLSALRYGHVAVGIQPARGYNIDPQASYHDPDLVPPHGYLAFYAWLRDQFRADAVVHMGKHGNLEWLPGKSLALSRECFPEAVFGPLPHLYPFIVNDPGEGTQAKRRAQAVIIDHLTPPLTRAETYGPLRDLERLVDEYYEASGVDPRRCALLREEIVTLARATGLDIDCGISAGDDTDQALEKLDNHLCELKELQIRDGLHIFGRSPDGRQRTDLLVALARLKRGSGASEASLIQALARDLGLEFDPLDCVMAEPWTGPRPAVLAADEAWRSTGDTVERLEILAAALVAGERPCDPAWTATRAVLDHIETRLAPAVDECGKAELAGLLTGLDGRFVPPGPSGAPTRGRPDVLPTGRNFYSVDTRTVPTPAAWQLGWKSACLLIERHLQDQGEWPRAMAVTAWGTSNMRTGGDDIAQALALMGVRPTWDSASRRVTGFEILPASLLDRPRVDVTLRVSGFFRDAFPGLIDLFDSAARAVAALDEPPETNPLAARNAAEKARLVAEGLDEEEAARRAGFRVFGSKPGAYGAGLQALIDEKGWQTDADLARAYVAWGGWAYGAGAEGQAEHGLFEERLKRVEAVVQNQDNREHDLLDSDDYYQFEGGMTAAVRVLSGSQPAIYHPDHSRPESPRIRSLEEEMARVVRARAANPKWIEGIMRHGYKGGFEMAATVDYLFAFAATARCVRDHHFDMVFDAYLVQEHVRAFLEEANPDALREMAERFQEALDRNLWRPRRNNVHDVLAELRRKPDA